MAETIQAALMAAGLCDSDVRHRPRTSFSTLSPARFRREVTYDLHPALRLELAGAFVRGDLTGVVRLTVHSIERFRERFEPHSSFLEAKISLVRCLRTGRWHAVRPRWVRVARGGSEEPLENVGFIVAGEGDGELVLPLALSTDTVEPLMAVTCLYPTPAHHRHRS